LSKTDASRRTLLLDKLLDAGPAVRVWEYDRLNSTVWQVDILLVNDTMFAHPKVTNPTKQEVPGYWWTCVAMTSTEKTRIVTQAETAIDNDACAPWPYSDYLLPNTSFHAWKPDTSYLGNLPVGNDFFFHIDAEDEPYIAHVQDDGFAVVHSHPKWLNGAAPSGRIVWNECSSGRAPRKRARHASF